MTEKFVKIRKNDLQKLTGWDLMVYGMLNKNYDSCSNTHEYNESMLLNHLNVHYKKNNAPREKSKIRKSLETLSSLGYISVEKQNDFFLVQIAKIDNDYVMLSEDICDKIAQAQCDLKTKKSIVKVFLCIYGKFFISDYAFPSLNTIAQETNLNKNTVIRAVKFLEELNIFKVLRLGLYKSKNGKVKECPNFYTMNFNASSEQIRRYAEADVRDFDHWLNL